MLQELKYNNKVYAYVMKANVEPETTEFYTPKSCSLQLGVVTHHMGYKEPKHIHKKRKKIIYDCIETLYIVYGKVRINFFNKDSELVGSVILYEGDTILLKSDMGHQLETIEKFKGIKVKQGPYKSIKDDKIFI